jgi:hypothetical protein
VRPIFVASQAACLRYGLVSLAFLLDWVCGRRRVKPALRLSCRNRLPHGDTLESRYCKKTLDFRTLSLYDGWSGRGLLET